MIIVNGNSEELAFSESIEAWLLRKGADPQKVAVEHNEKLLKRDEFASIILQNGDRLEVVMFVGGG